MANRLLALMASALVSLVASAHAQSPVPVEQAEPTEDIDWDASLERVRSGRAATSGGDPISDYVERRFNEMQAEDDLRSRIDRVHNEMLAEEAASDLRERILLGVGAVVGIALLWVVVILLRRNRKPSWRRSLTRAATTEAILPAARVLATLGLILGLLGSAYWLLAAERIGSATNLNTTALRVWMFTGREVDDGGDVLVRRGFRIHAWLAGASAAVLVGTLPGRRKAESNGHAKDRPPLTDDPIDSAHG